MSPIVLKLYQMFVNDLQEEIKPRIKLFAGVASTEPILVETKVGFSGDSIETHILLRFEREGKIDFFLDQPPTGRIYYKLTLETGKIKVNIARKRFTAKSMALPRIYYPAEIGNFEIGEVKESAQITIANFVKEFSLELFRKIDSDLLVVAARKVFKGVK